MSRLALIGIVSTFAVALTACSSSSGGGGTGPAPSATTTSPSGPTTAAQKGQITDFESGKPIAGATVVANDATTTTDAQGNYSLVVHQNEAFEMTVTAPGYVKLIEQQTTLTADYDRGKTTIVANGLASLLQNTLTGYDATKGILSVAVLPTGGCKTEDGSTIKVSSEDAKVKYFVAKLPSNTQTTVHGGEFPSAVIYNLPTNTPITVTIESPSCTQAGFPFTNANGIQFLGTVVTEPGGDPSTGQAATSFQRIFLQ
jgi:hypothetical protein